MESIKNNSGIIGLIYARISYKYTLIEHMANMAKKVDADSTEVVHLRLH